jgi:uncharacterized protein
MPHPHRPLILYLLLAFGLAWLTWLPLVLGTDGFHVLNITPSYLFLFAGSFAPGVAAISVTRATTGRWLPQRFFPPLSAGCVAAVLAPAALVIIGLVLLPYLLATPPRQWHLWWAAFAPLLVWLNVFGGPLGEEPGWRGFLLPQLSRRIGPTPAALLIGPIWTMWHLPLFFITWWGHPPWWFFLALCTAGSVILAYGVNLAGGSILAAILAHYTFNRTAAIDSLLVQSSTLSSARGTAILLGSFCGLALLLIVATRGRLGSNNSEAPGGLPTAAATTTLPPA